MHRFRKILTFVDASRDKSFALVRAVKLARRNAAQLTVVDVVQKLPSFVTSLIGDAELAYQRQYQNRLRALRGWVRGESMPTITKVLFGRPAIALVREVLHGGHDLLIKDAHVEEGTELLFGGVDLRLLRICPCPVWLVKADQHRPYERMLAAIDPQPTADSEGLNTRIIELASSLSKIEGSNLDIVSAWRRFPDAAHEFPDWHRLMSPDEGAIEQAARHKLSEVLAKSETALPTNRIHFELGRPSAVTLRVASEIDADLIVMGTVARSGIRGFLIGNTAERVLREVKCSVLTVKPYDFVSPITMEDESEPLPWLPRLKPA